MAKGSTEYNAGVKAFQDGKGYNSFPGKRGTAGTEDWVKGWEDANLKKGPVFQNSWHLRTVADIKACAKELGVTVSPAQINKVLSEIAKGSADDVLIPIIKGQSNSFQNGRTKALEAISNRHPILNATPFIDEIGKNEYRLVVDGKTAFTGKSQKECMEWAKANGITSRIDYSDK
jgi:hypothetical protein